MSLVLETLADDSMRYSPRLSNSSRSASRRAGSLMPAVALALAVVMLGAALVVDRLWLGMAHSELQRGAEAAALAAGRELASDELLREQPNTQARLMKARWAAARLAAENRIAGELLHINTGDDGDVRFGQLVQVTGQAVFLENESNPTSVVVNAQRTSRRQSAVWLAMQSLAGPNFADVVARAEATLDNHIVGVRTVNGLPLPTLPVAIRFDAIASENEPSKTTTSSSAISGDDPDQNQEQVDRDVKSNWMQAIEQRGGADRFGYDSSAGEVSEFSDGIPEITLRMATAGQNAPGNAYFVMVNGDLTNDDLKRQIRAGWSAHDLKEFSGELLLDRGPLTMAGLRGVDASSLNESLRAVIGRSRICLLYDHEEPDAKSSVSQLRCVGFVAGRVMSVREDSGSECEIVFQPAVMISRSVVVASELSGSTGVPSDEVAETSPKNRYLYKLRLTR